jgi:hypothetical protein
MIYPRENAVDLGGGKLQLHLYADAAADVANLPGIDRAAPGSDAYCLATQDVYILNGSGTWEAQ